MSEFRAMTDEEAEELLRLMRDRNRDSDNYSTSDELMDEDVGENGHRWSRESSPLAVNLPASSSSSSSSPSADPEPQPEWSQLVPYHSCEFEWSCHQGANWDMVQYHLDPHGIFNNHGIKRICLYHRFCGMCNRDLEKCHPSLGVKMAFQVAFQPTFENSCQYCIDCFKFWNEHHNPNRDDITGREQEKINQFLGRWFTT